MKGVPYHLQGKGVLQLAAEGSSPLPNWKNNGISYRSTEPTSVLDTRRSPSPPTPSTSTLSSSFGGAAGSVDSAGMAAVSDNPPHKWLPDSSSSAAGAASDGGGSSSGGSRKEEWANDLQPIQASLEIAAGSGEKCGLGMEEWGNVLSESASSPSNEQSFFQWFVSDMDDPSLKQLLQGGAAAPELESSGPGIGISDVGFGFEQVSDPGSANANAFSTPLAAAGAGLPSLSGGSNTCKLISVQNQTNPLPNFNVSCVGGDSSSNLPNPIFSSSSNNLSLPLSLPLSVLCQQQHQQQLDPLDEKPRLFNPPHLLLNQLQSCSSQNPAFLLPPAYAQQEHHLLLPPQAKRHRPSIPDPGFQIPKDPFSDSGQELFLRRQQQHQQQCFSNLHLLTQHLQHKPEKMKVMGPGDDLTTLQQQQHTLLDQLFQAAELIEAGNSIHARGILARLNHQLSPVGKPFQRAAFYFKDALQLLLDNNSSTPHSASPLDVVFKINSYKVFSEVSPMVPFVNFTSNQVLLEALDGLDRIHIVDFDIGLGGQWSSFMQELALRVGGAPSLKITAFASLSSQGPLELFLTRENLSNFASELGIPFEFSFFNMDSVDLSATAALPMLNRSENEAVAVNLPIGPSIPSLLRLVKHLSPKIVLSVDSGCDRSELSFPHHFVNALQSYSVLLDSLDALHVNLDAMQKIEKLMIQPKIESIVLGRHRAREKMPPWRSLFASSGFSPMPISNFTETQAKYLLNRLHMRGFDSEKRQTSLCLCWLGRELVSVSAWRC